MKFAAVGLIVTILASGACPASAQARFTNGSGQPYSVGVTSWRDMPFRRVVRQQYDYSCGSAAVATLLTYHYGRKTSEVDAFKSMFEHGDQAKIRKSGFSMLDMKNFLVARGLQADGYRMTLAALEEGQVPVIALVQMGRYKHFVVVKGIRDGRIVVGDPALGERIFTKAEFAAIWNGVALAIDSDKHPGGFNQSADWEVRPGAPLERGISRLPVSELTANLAPLYQISPGRSFTSQFP